MTNKNKKAIFATVISIIAIAVIVPSIFFGISGNEQKWKNDGVIEIWTTNDDNDLLFKKIKENFVDTFNEENTDTEVVLKTISVTDTLGSDIKLRMEAGAEVPNVFIGVPGDSIELVGFGKDTYVFDSADLLSKEMLQGIIPIYDKTQGRDIRPYAPFLDAGESLFINKELMHKAINSMESVKFSKEFIDEFKITKNDTDYSVISQPNTMTINMLNSYDEGQGISLNIFESYEGLEILTNAINQMYGDQFFTFGFDKDVRAAYYTTFNIVENNYDNWLMNSKNKFNFIDSKKSQDSFQEFINFMKRNKDKMWLRETLGTNPTGPFLNHELLMFTGANFNAKYMNSEIDQGLQYRDYSALPAPKKWKKDQEKEFSFMYTKSLNPIKFSEYGDNKEDQTVIKFFDHVYSSLEFEMFLDLAYIPVKTSVDTYQDYYNYISQQFSEELWIENPKKASVTQSLMKTLETIVSGEGNDNHDLLLEPATRSSTIFNNAMFQAVRRSINDPGFDPIGFMINQLETNND